jgi:hypothetical protein
MNGWQGERAHTMKYAFPMLCFLASPALGETKLEYLRDQYIRCTRQAYLNESAGRQFISDRNVNTAAERALLACRTEENTLSSALTLVMSEHPDLARRTIADFRMRLKNDLVQWFTELNVKAQQPTREPHSRQSIPDGLAAGYRNMTPLARR